MNRLVISLVAAALPLSAVAAPKRAPLTIDSSTGTVVWKRKVNTSKDTGKTWVSHPAYLFRPNVVVPKPGETPADAARHANATGNFLEMMDVFQQAGTPGTHEGAAGVFHEITYRGGRTTNLQLATFVKEWDRIWADPTRARPSVLRPAMWEALHVVDAGPKERDVGPVPAWRSHDIRVRLAPYLDKAQLDQLDHRIKMSLYDRTISGARLHRVTDDMVKHLAPETQKNLRGIAQLENGATGFVAFKMPGTHRALMFTNHHVRDGVVKAGEVMQFLDGGKASMVRRAGTAITRDYKAVEIDVSDAPNVEVLAIDARSPKNGAARPLRPGKSVYAPGGGTAIRFNHNPVDLLAGGPAVQSRSNMLPPPEAYKNTAPGRIEPTGKTALPTANFTLALGQIEYAQPSVRRPFAQLVAAEHEVRGEAPVASEPVAQPSRDRMLMQQFVRPAETSVATDATASSRGVRKHRGAKNPQVVTLEVTVPSNLPNAPGMSGSPVIDASTHRVIGLHSTGGGTAFPATGPSKAGRPGGRWEEASVPMDLVVADLQKQYDAGTIDPASRDLVGAFLAHAHQSAIDYDAAKQ